MCALSWPWMHKRVSNIPVLFLHKSGCSEVHAMFKHMMRLKFESESQTVSNAIHTKCISYRRIELAKITRFSEIFWSIDQSSNSASWTKISKWNLIQLADLTSQKWNIIQLAELTSQKVKSNSASWIRCIFKALGLSYFPLFYNLRSTNYGKPVSQKSGYTCSKHNCTCSLLYTCSAHAHGSAQALGADCCAWTLDIASRLHRLRPVSTH